MNSWLISWFSSDIIHQPCDAVAKWSTAEFSQLLLPWALNLICIAAALVTPDPKSQFVESDMFINSKVTFFILAICNSSLPCLLLRGQCVLVSITCVSTRKLHNVTFLWISSGQLLLDFSSVWAEPSCEFSYASLQSKPCAHRTVELCMLCCWNVDITFTGKTLFSIPAAASPHNNKLCLQLHALFSYCTRKWAEIQFLTADNIVVACKVSCISQVGRVFGAMPPAIAWCVLWSLVGSSV